MIVCVIYYSGTSLQRCFREMIKIDLVGEIGTAERFKTKEESRDVIEIFTANTLNHTDKGENLY